MSDGEDSKGVPGSLGPDDSGMVGVPVPADHPGTFDLPTGPPGRQAPRLSEGDEVIIHAKVVGVGPNGSIVVTVGPIDVPGHEEHGGYTQQITLQHAELAARI